MSLASLVSRRQAGALLAALSAAVVVACGGGGSDDGGGSMMSGGGSSTATTATSYAAGPITGFGSVIVNGVRYDDTDAQVVDAEDGVHGREQLKLGMMVEIDGRAMDRARGTGRALRIRFGSEILGAVGAVDTGAGTLKVLGQTVAVTDTTVFDDAIAGGLAGLSVGNVVEVYAMWDASSGQYRATRVELESAATAYRLRGPVADLDTTARSFTIGAEPISYAGLTLVPPDLANGMIVRVDLQTTQVAGQWVATALRPGLRRIEDRPGGDLHGIVTAFTSATDFAVNGMKVDATNAQFPDGTTGIVLGARVEVEGAVSGGLLVATQVELDDRHMGAPHHGFELHGLVGTLDRTAKTFVLRGVKVGYGGSVSWIGGTEADLAEGRRVEVRGRPSADRTQLDATEIRFE